MQPLVNAAPPDLTAPGAITALKTDSTASPLYSLTYNLGPTGLRGWIYISPRAAGTSHGPDGTITGESRQILVTVATTPGNGALQVDDLILGVQWGSGTGSIPYFSDDARKAFGAAITEAEKSANGGILRVKRWRAGTTTNVSITLPVMGTYSSTAPYNCPKSAAILASTRNQLVSQLLADPNFLTSDWKGAISGLALLAGVAPGDPDYSTVQTRLQSYAQSVAATEPAGGSLPVWHWGYLGLFLAEYYLSTGDANVLAGINQYSLKLARSQSMYGTFGHAAALPRPDGSGRMSVIGYGPVNSAGLPANLAMVMGKKALLAGAQPVDPQIDFAIQRASDFFAWYVNKGSIPYGEHHPWMGGHASNGKDPMAAVFFSQLDNRLAETEYFTRMSVAGFPGRESGHTGQGFSYLWEGMAANVGGTLAVSEYLKPVRWHLDLTRRSNGSFAYDGGEGYDAGQTSDGTYLGFSGYNGLNPTACFLLTYSLPLERLHITGKNSNPAHVLGSTKVADAVAAATYKFDSPGRTVTQLIGDLTEFDPIVRDLAAQELGTRSLSSGELGTLRTMLGGADANGRAGACQTLGLLKDSTAMSMITQRLDKTVETDPWVRATAATALRDYGTDANSEVDTMLSRFADNATDPDTIVWNDPLQASNSKLSHALFDSAPGTSFFDFGPTAINASKNLLYPAVSAGLKQPDSNARVGPAGFAFSRMPIEDVEALPNDFIELVLSETECDRMWSGSGRRQGIRVLSKYKFFETMPLGLSVLDVPTGFEWGSKDYVEQALTEIATYGDAARWTLPTLRSHLNTWEPSSSTHTTLVNAIHSIEAATISPAITHLKAAADSQVVSTGANAAKAITLTGSSSREPSVSFTVLTQPSHGILTGTPPNLVYTPNSNHTGPDHFTFIAYDTLTTSEPATVGIVTGTAGTGLKGQYFNNSDFTGPVLTRTDAEVDFDWGTGSPDASINADTFSVLWSGLLLVPETCAYTFSTLGNDGVRLFLNGSCVIDNFIDQNSKWTDSVPIQLTKGQMVEIQMEYYENTGSAAAKLKWTGPSVAGLSGAIIPQPYLYDGSGVANRTPYAHSQSVSTLLNTAKAITLTGSGGTLTYAVVSQPAHGTLTGTAPYLTYTPAANFSGTDSFTFRVNNGTGNSSPATVSISVAAGPPVTYTWASAVSANMGTGSSWVGGTAPPAAGLANGNLNFAPTGSYTATHNLNNGFTLNQLNFSGTGTIAGTKSLSFAANGGALPQLNQNSSNAVTVSTPLQLTATTTFGGIGGGKVTLTNLVSGNGGLEKTGPGTLQLNNVNNTYTGGTVLNNGTVTFPGGNGSATPFFGTGPITIGPGVELALNRTVLSNAMTLNGGIISGGNSFPSVLSGAITLTDTVTVSLGNTGNLQISGNLTGAGGITTIGNTEWTMNGTNSYAGPTTIQAGTLRYQAAAAVAPGALDIATGGKVNLNYSGNRNITSLTFGGIKMPPGSYGGSSSPATFKNDDCFTSTSVGTVTVVPVPELAGQTRVLDVANANGGINPATGQAWAEGDQYRLVFLTSQTTNAASDDIATYNAFVQGVAAASTTYPNLGSAQWKIVGSTSAVDARDNTGTNPNTATGVPVVLIDGFTVIANNNADLWNGIDAPVSLDENGAAASDSRVHTGTLGSGTKVTGTSDQPLGSHGAGIGNIRTGNSNSSGGGWMTNFNVAYVEPHKVFAMSELLTVVDLSETTPPTLASTNIVDDQAGGSVFEGTPVTYTLTFSEDMDAATVDSGDFSNAGTCSITIGAITRTSPGVFTVVVTPINPGSLRLQVSAGAVITDLAGNLLNTTSPIVDNTVITVDPVPELAGQLRVLDVPNANGGINPATGQAWAEGDQYRLVFLTSQTTGAASSNIATYNAFVQGVAAASTTYPNLGNTRWKIVGSTISVDARDNTGTNPNPTTGVPVLLMDGLTAIANNNADLWNGINVAVSLDENGTAASDTRVFTGTLGSGTKVTGTGDQPLGSYGSGLGNIRTGNSNNNGSGWITNFNAAYTEPHKVFAMSGLLTVVDLASAGPHLADSFDYAAGNVAGNNGGTGFGGAWVATRSDPTVASPGYSWGDLDAAGNYARGSGWSGLIRPVGSSLSSAGLMSNGSTLWFSVIMGLDGQNPSNADISIALGTDPFVSGVFGDRENLVAGEGIGVSHSGGLIQGVYWKNSDGDAVAERVENDSSTNISPNIPGNPTTSLIVGKIEWGANSSAGETLTLYAPGNDLGFGAPTMASWTLPALDQSLFDSLAIQFKDNAQVDEIRFGATFEDVVPSGGGNTTSSLMLAYSDMAAWAAGYPDADLSDPSADYDGDGLTNGEERIWGLDPTSGASVNPISSPFDPGDGSFSYSRRDPSMSGISYTVWTSTNMEDWTEDSGATQTPGEPDANGIQTVVVKLTATPVNGHLFARIAAVTAAAP